MTWHLNDRVSTPAGEVAAGSAGSGPALVLAHGWPWSSYAWHRILPALADHFEVFWYDMPGYGRSAMAEDQPTGLDVQGEVFAAMMAHWGLERPRVVAHDFGGATTLRAHLLHGCDFERYLLMNVVAMRPWGSAFFDHVGKHVEAFSGLPPHIHAAVVRAYIGGALVAEINADDVDRLVEPWLSEAGRGSFYRQFAQADEAFTAEVEPMFGAIRCPVHVVWGADDPWISIERGQALHAAIGRGDFVPLKGLGHLPQLEDPERVAATILAFMTDG